MNKQIIQVDILLILSSTLATSKNLLCQKCNYVNRAFLIPIYVYIYIRINYFITEIKCINIL